MATIPAMVAAPVCRSEPVSDQDHGNLLLLRWDGRCTIPTIRNLTASPSGGRPIPKLLLLAAAWTAWCLVHSLLILPALTRWLSARLPGCYRYHRVAYNVFAMVSLIPVVLFDRSARGEPLFAWDGAWSVLQAGLLLAAVVLFVLGGRGHDFRRFAGLAQIAGQPQAGDGVLSTTGILGYTRHPWYLGGILLIWAADLDAAVLVRNAVLTVYFVAGAWWEERKLVVEFGDAYRAYQRRVPMFLPVWRRRDR